jgi:phage baseplate assembly protein W
MAITTTHNTYGATTSIAVQRKAQSQYKRKAGFTYPLVGSFKNVTGQPPVLKNNVSEGGYFSPSTGVTLIRNNLRQLFLCNKGERVMLPDYGLNLERYVFEPLDETTYFLIKQDILKTLRKYFSIVNVITLSVLSSPLQKERSQLSVSLTLQILDESLDIFDVEVTIA